jgi:nonribosomal peptide synthetase DhbF
MNSGSRPAYRAPRTGEEQKLCALFAAALGTDRVGLDDDFFASGGDSMMVMQVALQIRIEFGREVPIRMFFEARTVGGLVERMQLA